jgi:hypothetical protein
VLAGFSIIEDSGAFVDALQKLKEQFRQSATQMVNQSLLMHTSNSQNFTKKEAAMGIGSNLNLKVGSITKMLDPS